MYGRPIPGLVFRQLFVAPMAARQAVKGCGHVDGVEALSLLPDDLQQGLRALVGGPGDLAVQPGHGAQLERPGSILGSWRNLEKFGSEIFRFVAENGNIWQLPEITTENTFIKMRQGRTISLPHLLLRYHLPLM